MVYYFLELIASLTFALSFSFTKLYQKNTVNNYFTSVVFLSLCSACGAVIVFAVNGFKLDFTPLSVILAASFGALGLLSTFITLLLLKFGSMSVYSQFMMLGGMVLPYFFGIFVFGEKLTDLKIVGLIVMVISLALTMKIDKNPDKKKTVIYSLLCVVAFFVNGTYSIIASIQGNASAQWNIPTVGVNDFTIWRQLFAFVFTVPVLAFLFGLKRSRPESVDSSKKIFRLIPIIAIVVYSVIGTFGNMLQLYCVPFVDSSILFPISTGGTVLFSTVLGFILYKEKANALTVFCLILTLISTVLFMLGDFFPNTYIIDLLKG
ncbi:MAG: hypothetical protein J5850_04955 [Clostridia bacterium]|nr:hypothetical protein [Clostridia bacterium]